MDIEKWTIAIKNGKWNNGMEQWKIKKCTKWALNVKKGKWELQLINAQLKFQYQPIPILF